MSKPESGESESSNSGISRRNLLRGFGALGISFGKGLEVKEETKSTEASQPSKEYREEILDRGGFSMEEWSINYNSEGEFYALGLPTEGEYEVKLHLRDDGRGIERIER